MGERGHRRPGTRAFDVMVGASVTALIGLVILYLAGVFDVSPGFADDPSPRSSTARNACQALVLDELPDTADTDFSDQDSTERLYPDRSWVIRGPVEVDGSSGEYVCRHLRELPPGSDHWRADRVFVLGV
ncbi:hypothetical protein [Actinomycetospora cinnamomea]|uniref:hypothetical protein n=1 Tax=Actinomycetospora cinnamomea TaxID=663609 RepID=UPI000E3102D8|nr:hypothetical protein [Actinomycetospora cinnamomea]